MRRLIILAVTVLTVLGSVNAEDNVNIGKSNIKLKSRMMTPEALWAMGRIGTVEASPNGQQIVYQVGYYSVKQNKSHQVICIMNADGSNNRQLTTSSKSETDPTWLDAERIAYLSGGEVWMMKADGSDRKQLCKSKGTVEGFKFSPDRKKVILVKSMPFHKVIKKNPDDLPKATGRRVTDLMYRHWDHYVESIQHPFVYTVGDGFAITNNGIDILEGEVMVLPSPITALTSWRANPTSARWNRSVVLSSWLGALTLRPSHILVARRWVSTMLPQPILTSIYII